MSKSKCPKCKRKMCVEYATYEECTDLECTYYVSYDYDIPKGMHES